MSSTIGPKVRREDCLRMICSFPRRYREKNLSPNQLLKSSWYPEYRKDISDDDIRQELLKDTGLVEDWLIFSMDQRHSPAWGFSEHGKNSYSIGFSGKGAKRIRTEFNDRFSACAAYVRAQMEFLIELDTRK